MAKKQSFLEKARLLFEQTDDVTKKLENELKQEFFSYIKNLRNQEKTNRAKEMLNKEIVSTAESIISSLLSESSAKRNEDVKN